MSIRTHSKLRKRKSLELQKVEKSTLPDEETPEVVNDISQYHTQQSMLPAAMGEQKLFIRIVVVVIYIMSILALGKEHNTIFAQQRGHMFQILPYREFVLIWIPISIGLLIALLWVCKYKLWKMNTYRNFIYFSIAFTCWNLLSATQSLQVIVIRVILLWLMDLQLILVWHTSSLRPNQLYNYGIELCPYRIYRQTLAFSLGWILTITITDSCKALVLFGVLDPAVNLFLFVVIFALVQLGVWFYAYGACSNKQISNLEMDMSLFMWDFGGYYFSISWAIIGIVFNLIEKHTIA